MFLFLQPRIEKADTVPPSQQEHRSAHRIMDEVETVISRALLAAFGQVRDAVTAARLAEALERGALNEAEAQFSEELLRAALRPVAVAYQNGVSRGGGNALQNLDPRLLKRMRRVKKLDPAVLDERELAPTPFVIEAPMLPDLARLPTGLPPGTVLDLMSPRVVDHIREQTGRLIVEISEETRKAVREAILRAYERGTHPTAAARHIRGLVGLTSRQALAVDNYLTRLLGEEIAQTRAQELAAKYAARLHRYRADMIARTEAAGAVNFGRQAMWDQLTTEGTLDPAEMEREWVAADDERMCPICGELDGQRVGMNEEFPGGYMNPTAHPNCRCTVRLMERKNR